MKNSSLYSSKIRKLYLSLKRQRYKPHMVTYDEPLDAIVYAVISENITESAAQAAIKRFADYFVDVNDLRVSRMEEIAELLNLDDGALARDIALNLIKVLKTVFDKFNMVSLEPLRKMSKRPARLALEKFVGENNFVIDYCMLTALRGHAIPLTKKMVEYLKADHLVHPAADFQEIEGFLARQISADNAYEFYILLRRLCESQTPVAAKAGARKKQKLDVTP